MNTTSAISSTAESNVGWTRDVLKIAADENILVKSKKFENINQDRVTNQHENLVIQLNIA